VLLTKPYFTARRNNGVKFEPDANTVLWLPGQDDAYSSTIRDRSGNGNDGTITGATWTPNSQGLWYLDFDGGDDKIVVADSPSLQLSNWTLKMWVKSAGAPTQNEGIITKDDAADRDFIWLIQTGGNQYISHTISNVGKELVGSDTVTDGIWRQLIVVNDGTSLILYNQGAQDAIDGTKGGTTDNDGFELRIGLWRHATEYLEGGMVLPLMLSTPWTATQVADSFNQERHLFGV
jgi:hypothetical protein